MSSMQWVRVQIVEASEAQKLQVHNINIECRVKVYLNKLPLLHTLALCGQMNTLMEFWEARSFCLFQAHAKLLLGGTCPNKLLHI